MYQEHKAVRAVGLNLAFRFPLQPNVHWRRRVNDSVKVKPFVAGQLNNGLVGFG